MKRHRLLMLAVLAVVALGASAASAQLAVPLTFTNDTTVRQGAFGIKPGANPCIGSDSVGTFGEFELPPVGPTGVFDARFKDPLQPPISTCFGEGSSVDIRPQTTTGQVDTFLIAVQQGDLPTTAVTWPSGLTSLASSMVMVDVLTGGLILNVDMLTTTSTNIATPLSLVYVITTWVIAPPPNANFTTLTPVMIFDENPLKPGKPKKPIKRFKGLGVPNWGNLLTEIVAQGGFRPKPLGLSDTAGGLVIGYGTMFLKNPVKQQWAPDKIVAATRHWVRMTKWDAIKVLGKGYGDIQKTLRSKTFIHTTGLPRGFDSTGVPGDLKRKPLKKQAKKLDPKKTPNRLFEEMVALNVNIAASALGKTPEGFGDLIFDQNGHPYDEWTLFQIRDRVNRILTYWEEANPNEFQDAYTAISLANTAFDGVGGDLVAADTASWEAGGELTAKLTLNGRANISAVSYLKLPAGDFVPTRIVAANNLGEAPEDFDDVDVDEIGELAPNAVQVYQNYPNPFNPATTLAFRLAGDAAVTISVYDMLGREVGTLLQGEEYEAGINTVEFDASSLSSGVYFYRITGEQLETGAQLAPVTGKMMLLK